MIDSFVNARRTDENQWDEMTRLHRIRAVFCCIDKLSEAHIEGMKIYQRAILEALRNNIDINVGLNSVKTNVQKSLKKYRKYSFNDIEQDIVRIQWDSDIQSKVKEKFHELETYFEAIQDYVDNPRGTYESYSKKINEVTDKLHKTSRE